MRYANFADKVEHYINEIKDKYKTTCENDQVRQDIINYIINAGNKKEVYFNNFIDIISRIKKEWGHCIINKDQSLLENPVGAGKIMSIFYKKKIVGKMIKRERFEICKIDVGDEYYSRRLLERY